MGMGIGEHLLLRVLGWRDGVEFICDEVVQSCNRGIVESWNRGIVESWNREIVKS